MQRFIRSIHFSRKVFWNSDSRMPFGKVWTAFTTLLSKLNWRHRSTTRFTCQPDKLLRVWQCVVECYHGARSIDASTPASAFKYAGATVAIPHGNTLHWFSLSWRLCADKWVLECRKNHHLHLPHQFLLAHLFLRRTGQLRRRTFSFRFWVEMHATFVAGYYVVEEIGNVFN